MRRLGSIEGAQSELIGYTVYGVGQWDILYGLVNGREIFNLKHLGRTAILGILSSSNIEIVHAAGRMRVFEGSLFESDA